MHKLEEATYEIDVFEALLERSSPNVEWGLDMGGDGSPDNPLTIMRVTPGSPAARIGLKSGDEVTEIGDTPTLGLAHAHAQEVIRQFGLSLILTVERRAQGAIPANPVVTPQNSVPKIASYQPYDMAGNPAAARPTGYDFQSVSGRPYDGTRVPVNASAPAHNHPQQNYSPAPAPAYVPHYAPPDDYTDAAGAPQSRTFKMLQGLMANDDNPPPVDLNRRPGEGGRGPVPPNENRPPPKHDTYTAPGGSKLQNRQFNTPIGMYSSDAISSTLQETHISSDGEKPVIKSNVLAMVREQDNEHKWAAGGGRASDKTGRAQISAPWMKKSGTRSAYNVYRQAGVENTSQEGASSSSSSGAARQAAVAGSAKPAGVSGDFVPTGSGYQQQRPELQQRQQPVANEPPAQATSFTTLTENRANSPAGYKPIVPKFNPNQPAQPAGQGQYLGQSPSSQGQFMSAAGEGQGQPAVVQGYQSQPVAGGLEAPKPAGGFRSVSPVFGSEAKPAATASSLDRNFNQKPRGFRSVAPPTASPKTNAQTTSTPPSGQESHAFGAPPSGQGFSSDSYSSSSTYPPMGGGSSLQQRAAPAPAAATTATGPGFNGEGGPGGMGGSLGGSVTYSGTEAHGADATDGVSGYNSNPSEPYAGSAGLPPPRSASMDKWREEQEAKRRAGPRVKVFMPQQYNSPIGMYSAGNVIDTFQTQAEVRMQDMERPNQMVMSEAQRAVLEEDATKPRY